MLAGDGDGAFAGTAGIDAVCAAPDGAWLAIRAVAVPAWTGGGRGPGGRILSSLPGPATSTPRGTGRAREPRPHALGGVGAVRVRPVAVLRGARTPAGEVAEPAAYLASPAGEYYAGCAFTLGATDG